MKKLLLIFLPYFCFAQTFKGFQQTQGITFTYKPNQLFESFPNSINSNPIQNAVPNGWLAWFEPSTNITLNGSTVSQWCDLTNTYCLTQNTAANQPTYVSGTRPYLSATSSNFMTSSGFGGIGTNNVWTIIIITSTTTFSSGYTCPISYAQTGSLEATGSWTLYYGSGDVVFRTVMTASSDALGTYTLSTNLNMLMFDINRTLGLHYSSANSVYHGASASNTTTLTDWSSGTLYLGRRSDGSYNTQRNIYDVIFYNRTLTNSEYNSLYSFFKAKYALP